MVRLFLLAVMLLSINLVNANNEAFFPADKKAYLEKLKTFMTSSKQKEMIDVYTEYENLFNTNKYSDKEFQASLEMLNTMHANKLKANPFFKNYLISITTLKKKSRAATHYDDLHTVLNDMIENSKAKIPLKNYLAFTAVFFEDLAFSKSKAGNNWQTEAKDFKLILDGNKPAIEFPKLRLTCQKKDKTIQIADATGKYFPVEKLFKGNGGKSYWRSDKMKNVYCELIDFSIDVSKGTYTAKEAKLAYKSFFGDKKILGTLVDKVVNNKSFEDSYPRFTSSESRINFRNFGDNLKFIGGFKLHGSTMIGNGDEAHKAELTMYDDQNKLIYKAVADEFLIQLDKRIIADRVNSVMYFENDSIYHPSVSLDLDIVGKSINLHRDKRGGGQNPFVSTYHQLNINTDKLKWYVNDDNIIIGEKKFSTDKSGARVRFESLEYFDEVEYRRLQSVSNTNPIALLKVVCKEQGTTTLDANVIAKKMNPNFNIKNIQTMLFDLVALGFINYDSKSGQVEVNDKLFHYADAAQKKKDYDNLKLVSTTDEHNAVLSTKNKDVLVNGIQKFEISRSQRVGMSPTDAQIKFQQNRDMSFDGDLYAGLTMLRGKKFNFNYDDYLIKLDSVRYFDLFVQDGTFDGEHRPNAVSIASRIENLAGILLIDAPGNKSGKEDIDIFPALNVKNNPSVFYDRNDIQNKAYSRDSFYFQIDPFSFNALDNLKEADLDFKGKLISADIFPPIKEQLVLRKHDFALGFETETKAEGLKMYGDKGNYIGKIDLSNSGLLGDGTLKYMTCILDSDSLTFLPKQTISKSTEFDITPDATGLFPDVNGTKILATWNPYVDTLTAISNERPFSFFGKSGHQLDGALSLTPAGLSAAGKFEWEKGIIDSEHYSFRTNKIIADSANFQVKTRDLQGFAIDTKNVNLEIDFEKNLGYFESNDEDHITEIPYNKTSTTMNAFNWDMNLGKISFVSEKDDLATFISEYVEQDSVVFDGTSAEYDLATSELRISGVPYVKVADAYVYPDGGNLVIEKEGAFQTLENAQIIANTKNKNHVINKATVNIKGKDSYVAKGFYEYNIGDIQQEIEFTDIIGGPIGKKKDKKIVTRAKGSVEMEDEFKMDSKIFFAGEISLNAESVNLQFEGLAKLDAQNLRHKSWFAVDFEADKNNLSITYDTPKNEMGIPVRTGLYINSITGKIYNSIMTPLRGSKDRAIIDGRGMFKYDIAADAFVFGDSLRVSTGSLVGDEIVYNDATGDVTANGVFEMGNTLRAAHLKCVGSANSNVQKESEEFSIDVITEIDFQLPNHVKQIIIDDIYSGSFDAMNANYGDKDFYKKALTNIIPDSKELFHALAGLNSSNEILIPVKKTKKGKKIEGAMPLFMLGKSNLKWDVDFQSFIAASNQNVLIHTGGKPINKVIETKMEIKLPINGDEEKLYFHITSPGGYYYYFGYVDGVLKTVSNNPKYNEVVSNLKKNERTDKLEDGEMYEIVQEEEARVNAFIRRIDAVNKK